MSRRSESLISVAIDLSSDEAADLASFLARVTPSALVPLTGLSVSQLSAWRHVLPCREFDRGHSRGLTPVFWASISEVQSD
jgi:hypothetical protein